MAKSKRTGKPESSTNSPATSKPSLRVRVADRLLEQLHRRTKAERKLIGEAMNGVLEVWGQPHRHSGAGIRRLSRTVFECRIGLDQRLAFVFIAAPPELIFFFLGNHDEIQNLLRSLR
jgi:hypothetical protein